MFLIIILGATDGRAPKGFAPIAIGLGLTLIHLIGIPVTNLSVNPARSTGPAVFVGGWALAQLWLFWVAPIIGALAAGFAYSWLAYDIGEPVVGDPEPESDGRPESRAPTILILCSSLVILSDVVSRSVTILSVVKDLTACSEVRSFATLRMTMGCRPYGKASSSRAAKQRRLRGGYCARCWRARPPAS